MKVTEREFQLDWIKLAGKEWGNPDGHPVLAIHGWMDNAASFDVLAPLLEDCHIIAIDTAGHGYSDHLPAGSVYNIWSDVADLFSVADLMGWQQFSLIGHSRGGNVGVIMAGTFPDRIQSLTLLDGGYPETVSAKKMPAVLAKSILNKQQPSQARKFRSRDQAIRLRTDGKLKITTAQAELFASRGLSENDGEYFWHADQKLKATSELRLTPALLQSFYKHITAPVLGIFAEQGLASLFLETPMLEQINNLDWHNLAGPHHFHMDNAAVEIASKITSFYSDSI